MQKNSRRRQQFKLIEQLESRTLLHAGHGEEFVLCVAPMVDQPVVSQQVTAEAQSAGPSVAAAPPAYNSLLGATDTLFLDFDGHFESQWGGYSNVATPEFNLDGVAGFNATELTAIQNIWNHVAEDFAPFNINVTTVDPGNFSNGVALRVAIGGSSYDWFGQGAGGVAYVDSFTNYIANVVYVFPQELSNVSKYIAEASSHEAGHGFGLQHQSAYSGTTRTAEYYAGPGDGRAPIMGNSYSATRGLWWNGQTTSSTTIQDDMAVLARSANTFGYRADDYGNTAASAFNLTPGGNLVTASGVISQTSDKDVFAFTTATGTVSFDVTLPAAHNLDSKLELFSGDGLTLIASSAPATSFGASINVALNGGAYRVVVSSNGGYGDVGRYTLNGTIVPVTDGVAAPTNFAAAATGTTVALNWTDNATNETGYTLQRSTGATFTTGVSTIALAANSNSYNDSGLSADTVYYYRVFASNASVTSDAANVSVSTIPAAPAALSATAISSSRIDLSWTDVNTETSYRIERSSDNVTYTALTNVLGNVTSYADINLPASTTFYYRVLAVNNAGMSLASPVASASTLAVPVTPIAPSNLRATSITSSRVTIAWNDNSSNETGFVIQRSTNGGSSWSTIRTTSANVTSYIDTVSKRKTYLYRVAATSAAGNSAWSNTITVTTPNRGSVVLTSATADWSEISKKRSLLA